jgi:hypothetical protein
MLIPFGTLAASGGVPTGDYELIETALVSTATPSVTFNNLGTYSSTYKHLQIRMGFGSNAGSAGTYTLLRFNGDSGSNYSRHVLEGTGSTVTSSNLINQTGVFVSPSTGTQNALHSESHVIDFLDSFSTTKNKTLRAFGGVTSLGHGIILLSGLWRSTSSITSITLQANSAGSSSTYGTGSRFSLYGIKG